MGCDSGIRPRMYRYRSLFDNLGSAAIAPQGTIDRPREAFRGTFDYTAEPLAFTSAELIRIRDANPLKYRDPRYLHVTFADEPYPAPKPAEFEKARSGEEGATFGVHAVYLFLPNGYGRTKLNNSFFAKMLGVKTTTRTWKTVEQLVAMVAR